MTGSRAPAVTAVVPAAVDDPRRPSGGNRYDRAVLDALRANGWHVREALVPGGWPYPDRAARRTVGRLLATASPGEPVLVDGLIASAAADLVAGVARSRRVVVLVHMPLGPSDPSLAEAEARMLRTVSAVVATSDWTRDWLISQAGVPAGAIHVAAPGAEPATPSRGSADGGRLLCVAAVTRAKGYDTLVAALSELAEWPPPTESRWRCTCVGSLEVESDFARWVLADAAGLGGRVRFTGALTAAALTERYANADLLVLPSRSETWGMVISEALARGIPVVAADVGGVPQALGRSSDGRRPGLLVPPGEPSALAGALRRWLGDAALRSDLRSAAMIRRTALPGWDVTAARLAGALHDARPPDGASSVVPEMAPGVAPLVRVRSPRAASDAAPAAAREGRSSLSR